MIKSAVGVDMSSNNLNLLSTTTGIEFVKAFNPQDPLLLVPRLLVHMVLKPICGRQDLQNK